jgi:hypothetical protein
MGKIKNNAITHSFSGSFGDDIVFRQIGNRTFFTRKAVHVKLPTPAQKDNRNLFAEAQNFASQALENPEDNEWYSIVAKVNGLKTAQLAAVRDYMSKPDIESIDVKKYKGNIGDVIQIKPKMLLKIQRINISIYDVTDYLIESGLAYKRELHWMYKASVFNGQVDASRIVLTAYDRMEKSCKVVVNCSGLMIG